MSLLRCRSEKSATGNNSNGARFSHRRCLDWLLVRQGVRSPQRRGWLNISWPQQGLNGPVPTVISLSGRAKYQSKTDCSDFFGPNPLISSFRFPHFT